MDGSYWNSPVAGNALRGVEGLNRRELLDAAYGARNPEARRLAALRLGDMAVIRSLALTDPSPIVRRRMVREVDDEKTLRRILESEEDEDVREAAVKRLESL